MYNVLFSNLTPIQPCVHVVFFIVDQTALLFCDQIERSGRVIQHKVREDQAHCKEEAYGENWEDPSSLQS